MSESTTVWHLVMSPDGLTVHDLFETEVGVVVESNNILTQHETRGAGVAAAVGFGIDAKTIPGQCQKCGLNEACHECDRCNSDGDVLHMSICKECWDAVCEEGTGERNALEGLDSREG